MIFKITTTVCMFTAVFFTLSQAQAQCAADKQKAESTCSDEKLTEYKQDLANAQMRMEAIKKSVGGIGPGQTAKIAETETKAAIVRHQGAIANCSKGITQCSASCESEASSNRAAHQEGAAQQNDEDKKYCEKKLEEKKAAATNSGAALGEALKGIGSLLAALGLGQSGGSDVAELPLCTRNPSDPSCVTDTANNDAGSTLSSGQFREASVGDLAEGDLADETAPVAGAPAAATLSGAMAGGAAPSAGGSGGAASKSSAGRDKDKKSEFDGSPKINLASGFSGGGGAASSKSGGGSIGKSGANPTAGRTSIDGDSNAGKIAQAAEERLRGPASNNEPLGGVSSVYYLDNFTKIEKRIMNERNTLQEH